MSETNQTASTLYSRAASGSYIMRTKHLVIGLFLLFGCTNSVQEKSENNDLETSDNDTIMPSESDIENSMVYNRAIAIWEYGWNSELREQEVIKLREVSNDTLTPKMLERIVNYTWPRVQIKYLKSSGDTAFILIPDSEVLTQQMGTAGAEEFMLSTTFTFTELLGISYVSYKFEEGDHAAPGIYNRSSWNRD